MVQKIEYKQFTRECPECGSKRVDMDHLSYLVGTNGKDLNAVTDDFYCEDCGATWSHIFVFSKTIITPNQEPGA